MIKIVKEPLSLEADSIESFVRDHPMGNYFQSPSLYHLYLKTSNYNPILLVSYGASKEINGVLLANLQREKGVVKGHLSSRCIVVGGPLVANDDLSVAGQLVQKLTYLARDSSIYIEFRQLFVGDSMDRVFQAQDLDRLEYYNYIMPTNDAAEIWKRLHQNRRRQIDRALREGARIVIADRIEQVREFYDILSFLYRTKVKKPLPPLELFENFFCDRFTGKYFLVEFRGKIIGGAVCPIYRKTIYEWYLCGLNGVYNKTLYPSVLATWAPIDYASKNGLTKFDFMGAGPVHMGYGVRDFKERFGGELVKYNRFFKINNRLMFQIGKVGLKVYSHFR